MAGACQKFGHALIRTKLVDLTHITDTKLSRCLSTFDLTTLGIGATLGAGIYVVAGQVAKSTAGPSVIVSFLIAAVASVFAGLCYAEFGARVPKTGSAYVYSYVTVGEIWAFTIGWNLILEYVIGTASVARAWSTYFDSIIDNKISHFFNSTMPLHIKSLSDYPDFFAFGITLVLTVVLCIGVKESSMLNNVFTVVNLLVVAYVVICGLFKVNFDYWSIPAKEVPDNHKYGEGGFFPYGFQGTLAGAATCFYAFVGFDVIATTGEEVRNPQKAIPVAIVISLLMCFLAYFGVSGVITLMVPYYEIDGNAPLPEVFASVGWEFAKYVIAIGAVCGLSTSLLGGMFPMPRVIYAMAEDGLLFHFLTWVPERVKTPVAATLIAGLLAATMAMFFDLEELVEMMSIGTLLAYTLVAACVLILRFRRVPLPSSADLMKPRSDRRSINLTKYRVVAFRPAARLHRMREDSSYDPSISVTQSGPVMVAINPTRPYDMNEQSVDILGSSSSESTGLLASGKDNIFHKILARKNENPSDFSELVSKICIGILAVVIIVFCAFLVFCEKYIISCEWWALSLVAVLGLVILVLLVTLWRQPENVDSLTFKVPLIPLVPTLSMFVNIYLMMKLKPLTWLRFGVWLVIGYIIYFGYGIWHSKEGRRGNLENESDGDEDGDATESESVRPPENTSLVYEGT